MDRDMSLFASLIIAEEIDKIMIQLASSNTYDMAISATDLSGPRVCYSQIIT